MLSIKVNSTITIFPIRYYLSSFEKDNIINVLLESQHLLLLSFFLSFIAPIINCFNSHCSDNHCSDNHCSNSHCSGNHCSDNHYSNSHCSDNHSSDNHCSDNRFFTDLWEITVLILRFHFRSTPVIFNLTPISISPLREYIANADASCKINKRRGHVDSRKNQRHKTYSVHVLIHLNISNKIRF